MILTLKLNDDTSLFIRVQVISGCKILTVVELNPLCQYIYAEAQRIYTKLNKTVQKNLVEN